MPFVLAALLFFLWLALLTADAPTSLAYLCLVASALLLIAGFTRQRRPAKQSSRQGLFPSHRRAHPDDAQQR